MNEFNKETDETHDGKPNRCGHGNLLKFFSVGFCASLYEPDGVFDELPAGLDKLHYLIHGVRAVSEVVLDEKTVRRMRAT